MNRLPHTKLISQDFNEIQNWHVSLIRITIGETRSWKLEISCWLLVTERLGLVGSDLAGRWAGRLSPEALRQIWLRGGRMGRGLEALQVIRFGSWARRIRWRGRSGDEEGGAQTPIGPRTSSDLPPSRNKKRHSFAQPLIYIFPSPGTATLSPPHLIPRGPFY